MELSITTSFVVRPEACLLADVVLPSNCLQTTSFVVRTDACLQADVVHLVRRLVAGV